MVDFNVKGLRIKASDQIKHSFAFFGVSFVDPTPLGAFNQHEVLKVTFFVLEIHQQDW